VNGHGWHGEAAVSRTGHAGAGTTSTLTRTPPVGPEQVFANKIGFGRGYPWAAAASAPSASYPVATQVVADSLTLQKRHLRPDADPALDLCADGFEKVRSHLGTVTAQGRTAS
jgi:perosamine synthetase